MIMGLTKSSLKRTGRRFIGVKIRKKKVGRRDLNLP